MRVDADNAGYRLRRAQAIEERLAAHLAARRGGLKEHGLSHRGRVLAELHLAASVNQLRTAEEACDDVSGFLYATTGVSLVYALSDWHAIRVHDQFGVSRQGFFAEIRGATWPGVVTGIRWARDNVLHLLAELVEPRRFISTVDARVMPDYADRIEIAFVSHTDLSKARKSLRAKAGSAEREGVGDYIIRVQGHPAAVVLEQALHVLTRDINRVYPLSTGAEETVQFLRGPLVIPP